MKSDKQSDQIKISPNEIADTIKCNTELPAETEVRARRKKRQFYYEEAVDEHLTEENKFKINFFNYILDIILNSLETYRKNFHFPIWHFKTQINIGIWQNGRK